MQGVQVGIKKKTSINKRRGTFTKRTSNVFDLELLIQENGGKHSTCHVPIREIMSRRETKYKKYVLVQSSNTQKWQIVGKTTNVVTPKLLVNRKITLKKGNEKVEGIVLKAVPLGKGPEGGSVPVPPPPLDE